MKKILIVFGTRPEALKLIPVYKEFIKYSELFETKICVTSQHKEMLWDMLNFFEIQPEYDLAIMSPNQTLFDITSKILLKIKNVFDDFNPDLIITQGDTTTTFVASLAGFYTKTKIAHIEAGLRSNNKYSPFPEEINRALTSRLADFHFAPTRRAVKNLRKENIKNNVFLVGNTIIDTLFLTKSIIEKLDEDFIKKFNFIDLDRKIILVTGHRRESFGEPFRNICNAIRKIASIFPEFQIIYPVHLNPNVQEPVQEILHGLPNVFLIEPQKYPEFVWLMNKSYFILTDSGGVQEEAPSLGKPVLVMREVTERTEGIQAGTAMLVGTKEEKIIANITELVNNEELYSKMATAKNPYGDGKSSKRILRILKKLLSIENS